MIGYSINNYVWELLKKKLGWNTPRGLNNPFVPAQQQPELMNGSTPFVVYQFSTEFNAALLEPQETEVVSYLIYGRSVREVDSALTLIKNAFKAEFAAHNINIWLNKSLSVEDGYLGAKIVTFTQVMNTESAGPVDSEGGWHEGFISLRVGFHTDPEDYSV